MVSEDCSENIPDSVWILGLLLPLPWRTEMLSLSGFCSLRPALWITDLMLLGCLVYRLVCLLKPYSLGQWIYHPQHQTKPNQTEICYFCSVCHPLLNSVHAALLGCALLTFVFISKILPVLQNPSTTSTMKLLSGPPLELATHLSLSSHQPSHWFLYVISDIMLYLWRLALAHFCVPGSSGRVLTSWSYSK